MPRLTQIPSIKPDEHIVGLAVRACLTSGYSSNEHFFERGLSTTPQLESVDYLLNPLQQRMLRTYAERHNRSPIDLMWSHTNLRYYFNALPEVHQQFILSKDVFSIQPKSLTKLRPKGNVQLHKTWRWCPACAKEDEECHGFSYWHVSHQTPGLLYCPHHPNTLLIEQCSHCHDAYTTLVTLELPPHDGLCRHCHRQIAQGTPPSEVDQWLNEDTLAWTRLTPGYLSAEKLNHLYKQAAKHQSDRLGTLSISPLSSSALCTLNHRLQPSFERYFGDAFLHKIAMRYRSNGEENTHLLNLQWLMTKDTDLHPVIHLLMTRFLVGGVDKLVQSSQKASTTAHPTTHSALTFLKELRKPERSQDVKRIANAIFFSNRKQSKLDIL